MRKFGKYEKMPDGTKAKQPAVKSALLQTYFTSLICLVLCVTMFFGTTFAWFTSEVTNSGNEIYIGILDVGLFAGDDDLSNPDNKLFDNTIHWEPGYTTLETVKIVNEGDLAFRYELMFTNGSVVGGLEADLENVAQWFDVWCYHDASNGIPKPENYEEINEDNGWKKLGTLKDVLDEENSKAIFSGRMTENEVAGKQKTTHTYTIALHMNGEVVEAEQQEALNALMGKKISLNVKLVATQLSSEEDAFDNQYDAGANDKIPTIAPVNQTVVAYDLGNFNNVLYNGPMDVYTFDAADFQDAYPVEDYKDWLCDFYVSTDAPLDTGLMLVGHYPSFSEKWLGFYAPESTEAYPPTPLLGTVTSGGVSNWTYYDICEIVQVFKCGLIDSESKNTGTKVTVDLRMIDPANSENVIVVTRIVVKLNAN